MATSKSIWRNPSIYLAIIVALIAIPTLMYAITKSLFRKDVDNGFMSVDIDGRSVPLTLAAPPLEGGTVWAVVADDSVDVEILDRAVTRWNQEVGEQVFSFLQDQAFFDNPKFVLSSLNTGGFATYRFGTVSIRVFTDPFREDVGGLTSHAYDLKTGKVHWVDISINPLHTNDRRSYEAALVHELGHALLLDHDDHRTSIMRESLNRYGTITFHDAGLVKRLWIENRQERL